MVDTNQDKQAKLAKNNLRIALGGGLLAISMVGASFAAVPLYQIFCQVTGYGGTTQRADGPSARILDREITVRFDANVSNLPWDFQPVKRSVTMKIGQTSEGHYTATNTSNMVTAGEASFNVTPDLAGAYFNKIECFCFTRSEIKPGQSVDMPVVFYIDPDIVDVPELKDLKTITLSYSFSPSQDDDEPVASLSSEETNITN